MAASSISCCLGPPAPPKEATTHPQPRSAGSLRRACVAVAACAVMGMADGGADMVLALDSTAASRAGDVAAVGTRVKARAPPRWSDRRQCPPWRANSLENIVPENLPRSSAQRRFNSVSAAEITALAPDVVAPFLALRSGADCFSL